MLMLELSHNGTKIRCSTHYKPLEHQWYGYVSRIDPVLIKSNKEYGGWLRTSLPVVTFTSDLFDIINGKILTYPPPQQISVVIKGGLNEVTAIELCRGVLSLKSIGDIGIEYEMYSSPYIPIPDETQALAVQYSSDTLSWNNTCQVGDRYLHASLDGGTTYGSAVQFVIPAATSIPSWGVSNTLVGFFTKVCTCLGLVLDSSLAIASPPVISGTVSVDTLVLDVADSVAAYFCHYFYIDSGVLHLIDAASVNGAAYNFGLWDYLKSPKYTWLPPVNQVYDDAGKRYILGNTLFGRVLAVGVSYYATDTTYLQKVATYSGLPVVELSAMDFYGQFVPGRLLTWVDDRHAQTIVGSMQMRAVQYDFGASGDRVTIIGSSTLTT